MQLRHDDGGTLVGELYGHPDAAIARERIRAAFRTSAPVVALPKSHAASHDDAQATGQRRTCPPRPIAHDPGSAPHPGLLACALGRLRPCCARRMNIDNPNLPYQKIDLQTAVRTGIAREAQCRVDGDGVERCYHPQTGVFWEAPGHFPIR